MGAAWGGAPGARGRDAGVHLGRGDHVCSIVSRSCAVVREVMAPGTPALLPSRTTRDSPNLGADWSSGHASRILPPDIYFSSLNKTCTRRLFCLPLRSAFRVLFHIVYEVSPGTGLEEVFFQFSKADLRATLDIRVNNDLRSLLDHTLDAGLPTRTRRPWRRANAAARWSSSRSSRSYAPPQPLSAPRKTSSAQITMTARRHQPRPRRRRARRR